MAARNAKTKKAIAESVVLSDIDAGKIAKPAADDRAKAKADAKAAAEQKITARQKRDVGNKIKRREVAEARAKASRSPFTPKSKSVSTNKLVLPVDSTVRNAVDQIKRGEAKKVMGKISDRIANKDKAGTKAATAGQRRRQNSLNQQGAQIAEQQRAQQLQDRFEGNTLSPTEKRKHEFVIAKAIRLQGHLNDATSQASVAALGTKYAGYIAGREFERIANEKQ